MKREDVIFRAANMLLFERADHAPAERAKADATEGLADLAEDEAHWAMLQHVACLLVRRRAIDSDVARATADVEAALKIVLDDDPDALADPMILREVLVQVPR